MLLKGDYVVVDNKSSNLNKKLGIVIEQVQTYHSTDRYKVEILDKNIKYRLWDIERGHLRFVDHKALIDLALSSNDKEWFRELSERFKVIP